MSKAKISERLGVWLAEQEPLSATAELFANLVGLVFVVGIGLGASLIWDKYAGAPSSMDLPERIKSLTGSLNSAAQAIGQIEGEIRQREALVERLKRDAETATKLSTLNKDQVDAVAQALKTEIQKEQQSGFWASQAVALFYTLLGVVLAELYHWIGRWRRRRKLLASSNA